MRIKILAIFAVSITVLSSAVMAQQTAKITSSNVAYLEYLPQGYHNNSSLYPLVISLHGIKERGTTSTDPNALKTSVQTVANVGLPKYVKYGQQYPFILISPQLKTTYGTWPAAYVMDVINYVKKNLRVDPNRIYITGLSLGGFGVWTTLGAYPNVFAAALPVCAGGNAISQASAIAKANVPVWGFHGDKDATVSYTVTTSMVNAVNASTPKPNPLAKATLFAGLGHIIWDKVYNQTNSLDWMLSYKKGSTSPSPSPTPTPGETTTSNSPPAVNAGADRRITLPTNSVELQGTASDSDGIASLRWSKVSGGAATLSGEAASRLRVSNMIAGTYVFRLTAADKKGATKSDDVTVVVAGTSSTANKPPVANAGPDRAVKLPATSIKLSGSASDSDGKITSYAWMQYGGPAGAAISGANSLTPTISGLKAGNYYFRLTVKDDKGASHFDNMLISVK